jgi:hypothetical protein
MKKQIRDEILIQDTPERVWKVLTDFKSYPEWNPFILSLEGHFTVGDTIVARIAPPGGSPMVFKPVVLVYDENRELRWKGKLLIPGLFDGEHCFQLRDNGDGTTTFIQSEDFSGILVRVFSKMLDNNTLEGFRQMNQALKTRAEA